VGKKKGDYVNKQLFRGGVSTLSALGEIVRTAIRKKNSLGKMGQQKGFGKA